MENVGLAVLTFVALMALCGFALNLLGESVHRLSGEALRGPVAELQRGQWSSYFAGSTAAILLFGPKAACHMALGLMSAGLSRPKKTFCFLVGAALGGSIVLWILALRPGPTMSSVLCLFYLVGIFLKNEKLQELCRGLFALGVVFWSIELLFQRAETLAPLFLNYGPQFLLSDSSYLAGFVFFLLGAILGALLRSGHVAAIAGMALGSYGLIGVENLFSFLVGTMIYKGIDQWLLTEKAHTKARALVRLELSILLPYAFIVFSLAPWFGKSFIKFTAELLGANLGQEVYLLASCFFYTGINGFYGPIGIFVMKRLFNFFPELSRSQPYEEQTTLKLLGHSEDFVPSTALLLAHKELEKFIDIVGRMFDRVESYLAGGPISAKGLGKIKEYERATDNIQKEMAFFVRDLMQKKLSPSESAKGQELVKMALELECVADYLDKLATGYTHFVRNSKDGEILGRQELYSHYLAVKEFYLKITKEIVKGSRVEKETFAGQSLQLKQEGQQIRENFLQRMGEVGPSPQTVMTYGEMIHSIKKIKSHAYNLLN